MKVKDKRGHMNGFGGKTQKADGDEYEVPEKFGKNLIAAGFVDEVKEKNGSSTSSEQTDGEKAKGGKSKA